jgi:hypothetical protein
LKLSGEERILVTVQTVPSKNSNAVI